MSAVPSRGFVRLKLVSRKVSLHRLQDLRRFPLFPTVVLSLLAVVAAFGPLIAPHHPTAGSLRDNMMPPFWVEGGSLSYPLGTDFQGRDILSRMIYGARISVIVAAISILFSATVGTSLGLLGGYYGGFLDHLIMRISDIFFALPAILLALVFAQQLGPSLNNVIIIILLILWCRYARQVRAEVLSIRERDYVASARVSGASAFRIMLRHILPNVVNTILVLATWYVGFVILLESTLSFLGVGIPPPAPAWGVMIADGRRWITEAWWISVIPGFAVAITILAFNLLGDWLRDYLDPALRQL